MMPVPAPAPAPPRLRWLPRPFRRSQRAPREVARNCRLCGAHFVGFSPDAAGEIAAHNLKQATSVLHRDEPKPVRELRASVFLLRAFTALESTQGYCPICSGKRWELERGRPLPGMHDGTAERESQVAHAD